jgi:hypothetical protein
MHHHTHAVSCPVCGREAVLAISTGDGAEPGPVDPNDVGLMCPGGCRPTVEQIRPLVDVAD